MQGQATKAFLGLGRFASVVIQPWGLLGSLAVVVQPLRHCLHLGKHLAEIRKALGVLYRTREIAQILTLL
jgi:hypothetical protein